MRWLYKKLLKQYLGGGIKKLDGYKTVTGAVLSLTAAAYLVFTGEAHTEQAMLQAVFDLALEYGHDPLLTSAQTLAIVGAIHKAAKALAKIWSIVRNAEESKKERQGNLDTRNGNN